MKTNLTIIVAASLLSLTPVQASETGWYVGAGYGKAKLVYNTKKALDKSIDKSVSTQTNNPNNAVSAYVDIETSSVPSTVVLKNAITLNESYDQNQYNFYIGYKFSNRFGVEVGQQHYTFQARAALPVNMSFARSGTVEDQSGMIDATGNITALATATTDMTVTTLVMTYDLIKTTHTDTFLKLGAGYGNAKLTSNEQYDYRYTYNTCINNTECYSGHNSATVGNTSSSSSYSGYLPVYGIGTNYNLTKTSTIRVEGVRLGVGSTRVDTVTVGVLFRL
jgi:hypothetical protein